MENRILVPLDYSSVSEEVAKIADEWAQRTEAELHFLRVDPDYMENGDVDLNIFINRFDNYVQNFELTSKYKTHLRLGTPYLEIITATHEIEPDLIIMGAHSHTLLGRIFPGSNTDYVLHHCQCPVYVHKQSPNPFENRIIVPIDYTEVNKEVVRYAGKWAERTGAILYFIHTDPVPEYPGGRYAMEAGFYQPGDDQAIAEIDQNERDKDIKHLRDKFDQYLDTLDIKAQYKSICEFGKPYLKIQKLQQEINAGLIMMAAHSHTLLNRLFVGSNTDYLMHHLNCPMYIYKEAQS